MASVGTFGNSKTSDVDINDIDIFYTYAQDRNIVNTQSKATRIDATTVLTQVQHPDFNDILGGMYNLTLPSNIFTATGIYNILIKPKEIRTTIVDVGVLSSRVDIRGLLLDTTDSSLASFKTKLSNGGLVGYRIEYLDPVTNLKTPNIFRIVTSANRCEPITENLTNVNQKSIRYRFNDVSNLLFLTLTPSAVSNIKPTETPFIGNVGQEIIIYNTFFDPIMLEIEYVNNTIDTVANLLTGNQVETADGKLITYDDNDNIIYQGNLFVTKDDFDNPLTKVKQKVDVIDNTLTFDSFINNIP